MPLQQSGNSPFNLVLSTWFVMYLLGDRPGGLPNDFLTRGTSSLLVFDTILCDQDALEAEERFAGTWLSSDILVELKKEGILKPVNIRELLPSEFFEQLRNANIPQIVRAEAEAQLLAIGKGKKGLKSLKLSPLFTWLNQYMFTYLKIPDTSARYEWEENHFKPPRVSSLQLTPEFIDKMKQARKGQRLFVPTVEPLLPEFSLLPPIPANSEAREALRKNIDREKVALYRWIYGDPDMSRDKYHEFRLGPDFRHLDAKIDEPRRAQAWQNFELLLEFRGKTKDIRSNMQKIIADVLDGRRTRADVGAELHEQEEALNVYLPSARSLIWTLGLSGAGLALTIEAIISTLSHQVPALVDLGLDSFALLSGAYGTWGAASSLREHRTLRQRYPYAWFVREFRKVQETQRREHTPHRRRT